MSNTLCPYVSLSVLITMHHLNIYRKLGWRAYALRRPRLVLLSSTRRRRRRHVGQRKSLALSWMIIIGMRISLSYSIIICCGVSKRQRCVYLMRWQYFVYRTYRANVHRLGSRRHLFSLSFSMLFFFLLIYMLIYQTSLFRFSVCSLFDRCSNI